MKNELVSEEINKVVINRYEELRNYILTKKEYCEERKLGIGLFTMQGMLSWINAYSNNLYEYKPDKNILSAVTDNMGANMNNEFAMILTNIAISLQEGAKII